MNRHSSAPFGSFANAKARAGVTIIAAFAIVIILAILAATATAYAFTRISAVLADQKKLSFLALILPKKAFLMFYTLFFADILFL